MLTVSVAIKCVYCFNYCSISNIVPIIRKGHIALIINNEGLTRTPFSMSRTTHTYTHTTTTNIKVCFQYTLFTQLNKFACYTS